MTPEIPKLNDPPEKKVSVWEVAELAEKEYGLPTGILRSLGMEESNGLTHWDDNGKLVASGTGPVGAFQFTRATAKQYGINREDPVENVIGAAKYLKDNYNDLKTRVDDDDEAWVAAAVAHNRGLGAVHSMVQGRKFQPRGVDSGNGGNTEAYATRIANNWLRFRQQLAGQPVANPVQNIPAEEVDASKPPLSIPRYVPGKTDPPIPGLVPVVPKTDIPADVTPQQKAEAEARLAAAGYPAPPPVAAPVAPAEPLKYGNGLEISPDTNVGNDGNYYKIDPETKQASQVDLAGMSNELSSYGESSKTGKGNIYIEYEDFRKKYNFPDDPAAQTAFRAFKQAEVEKQPGYAGYKAYLGETKQADSEEALNAYNKKENERVAELNRQARRTPSQKLREAATGAAKRKSGEATISDDNQYQFEQDGGITMPMGKDSEGNPVPARQFKYNKDAQEGVQPGDYRLEQDGRPFIYNPESGEFAPEVDTSLLLKRVEFPLAEQGSKQASVAKNIQAGTIADAVKALDPWIPKQNIVDFLLKRGFTNLQTGEQLPEERFFSTKQRDFATGLETGTDKDFYNLTEKTLKEIREYSDSIESTRDAKNEAKNRFMQEFGDEYVAEVKSNAHVGRISAEDADSELAAYQARIDKLTQGYIQTHLGIEGFNGLTKADIEKDAADAAKRQIQQDIKNYGSIQARGIEDARFAALPASAKVKEAARSFASVIPTMASQIIKSVGGLAELAATRIPEQLYSLGETGKLKKMTALDETYAYRLGDYVDQMAKGTLEGVLGQKNELAASSYWVTAADGFGQVLAQAGSAWASGGSSLATGTLILSQGFAGQYDDAKSKGIPEGQRLSLGVIGAIAGAPDILLTRGWFKAFAPAEKTTFLRTMFAGALTKLESQAGEAEARNILQKGIAAFVGRAKALGIEDEVIEAIKPLTLGEAGVIALKGATFESAQELTENKVNKIAEKLIFNPKITWQEIQSISSEDIQAIIGGLAGGIGGAGIEIASHPGAFKTYKDRQARFKIINETLSSNNYFKRDFKKMFRIGETEFEVTPELDSQIKEWREVQKGLNAKAKELVRLKEKVKDTPEARETFQAKVEEIRREVKELAARRNTIAQDILNAAQEAPKLASNAAPETPAAPLSASAQLANDLIGKLELRDDAEKVKAQETNDLANGVTVTPFITDETSSQEQDAIIEPKTPISEVSIAPSVESQARRDVAAGINPESVARNYNLTPEQVGQLAPLGEIGDFGQTSYIMRAGLSKPENIELLNSLSGAVGADVHVFPEDATFEDRKQHSNTILDTLAKAVGAPRSSAMTARHWETAVEKMGHKMSPEAITLITDALTHQEEWHKQLLGFVYDPELEAVLDRALPALGAIPYKDIPKSGEGAKLRKEILKIGRKYGPVKGTDGTRAGLSDPSIHAAYDAAVSKRLQGEPGGAASEAGVESQSGRANAPQPAVPQKPEEKFSTRVNLKPGSRIPGPQPTGPIVPVTEPKKASRAKEAPPQKVQETPSKDTKTMSQQSRLMTEIGAIPKLDEKWNKLSTPQKRAAVSAMPVGASRGEMEAAIDKASEGIAFNRAGEVQSNDEQNNQTESGKQQANSQGLRESRGVRGSSRVLDEPSGTDTGGPAVATTEQGATGDARRSYGVPPNAQNVPNYDGRPEVVLTDKKTSLPLTTVHMVHYAPQERSFLDSSKWGTNASKRGGAEKSWVLSSKDERLKHRIYGYVDQGTGIAPKSDVGQVAHVVQLNFPLYDMKADADGIVAKWNKPKETRIPGMPGVTISQPSFAALESAILDAGYRGYVADGVTANNGVVVLLGQQTLPLFAAQPSSKPVLNLTGQKSPIKVDGVPVEFGGFQKALDAAKAYMAGRSYNPVPAYQKLDKALSARIANAYDTMPHAPNDPKVKAAYEAMITETLAQWEAIKKTGLKVQFNKNGVDPYGNPRNAILDVVNNNHLWVFPTDDGYGTLDAGSDQSENPMLRDAGEVIGGHKAKVNDIFRIVHDYFGHIKDGNGFRAEGEENAWYSHAAMYSPLARQAVTSETRGQNSWVNFGPHAEANATANGADTVYADQKIGLMPEWTAEPAREDIHFSRASEPVSFAPPYTITALTKLDKFTGRQVKTDTIGQILKQADTKQIERDIVNQALRQMEVEEGATIDYDEFAATVKSLILPLRIINSQTYASYGADNVGIDDNATYETHIYNTDLYHRATGHFSGDFSTSRSEDWGIRPVTEASGQVTYVAVRAGANLLTQADIEENVGTASKDPAKVEEWIRSRNSLVSENNSGLFGHSRVAREGTTTKVMEGQSDAAQQHDLAELVIKDKIARYRAGVGTTLSEEMFNAVRQYDVQQDAITDTDPNLRANYARAVQHIKEDRARLARTEVELAVVKAMVEHREIASEPEDSSNNDQLTTILSKDAKLVKKAKALGLDVVKLVRQFRGRARLYSQDRTWDEGVSILLKGAESEIEQGRTRIGDKEQEIENYPGMSQYVAALANQKGLAKKIIELAPIQDKQFIAHKKNYTIRLLREEIRREAGRGQKKLQIPTPRTLALIEGYISPGGENGGLPYEIVSGDNERLSIGDVISFGGVEYQVVRSDPYDIEVAPADSVQYEDYDSYAESEAEYHYEEAYSAMEKIDGKTLTGDEILSELRDLGWPVSSMTSSQENRLLSDMGIEDGSETVDFDLATIKDTVKDIVGNAEYDLSDYLGDSGYTIVSEDHYGVTYVTSDADIEGFLQPDQYEEAADIAGFDLESFGDTQRTILDKYVELNEFFKKERPDAEIITDLQDNEWLSTDLTPADAKETVVFNRAFKGQENAAIEDITRLAYGTQNVGKIVSKSTLTFNKEDNSIDFNLAGQVTLAAAVEAYQKQHPGVFWGMYLKTNQVTGIINAFKAAQSAATAAGATADAAKYGEFITALVEAQAASATGDVVFAVDSPAHPLLREYSLPEERLHQADFRATEFTPQDRTLFESLPAYRKALRELSKQGYVPSNTSAAGMHREIIAKMLREDNPLNLSEVEIDALQDAYAKTLYNEGVEMETVRELFAGLAPAAGALIGKYETYTGIPQADTGVSGPARAGQASRSDGAERKEGEIQRNLATSGGVRQGAQPTTQKQEEIKDEIAMARPVGEQDRVKFNKDLDEYYARKLRGSDPIILANEATPLLARLGLPDTQLQIMPHVVAKGTEYKHQITPNQLRQLATALNDPIMVIDDPQGHKGGLGVLTSVKDSKGNYILVIIHPGKKTPNTIPTVFGVENIGKSLAEWTGQRPIANWANKAGKVANLVKYWDKDKGQKLSRTLPINSITSEKILTTPNILTNEDFVKSEAPPSQSRPVGIQVVKRQAEDVGSGQKKLDAIQREVDKDVTFPSPDEEIAFARASSDTANTPPLVDKRSQGRKVADIIVDISNVPRAAKASVDLSAGRQAAILVPANPILFVRSFAKQFTVLGPIKGQERFEQFAKDMEANPYTELGTKMGLYLVTAGDGGMSAREEAFTSQLLGNDDYFKNKTLEGARKLITYPVRASERAYVTLLDSFRVNVFAKMVRQQIEYNNRKGKDVTPEKITEQLEGLARFVNYATGRGDLGRLNDFAPVLNAGFFSIRYWASRLQVMNLLFYARLPKGARKIAITNMAAFIGTAATVMFLLKLLGAKVEIGDEDDADYLRVKIGNFSYDFGAGLPGHLRYIARMSKALRMAATGSEKEKKKATNDLGYITGRYLRGKLAPIPSAAWNSLTGTDIMGKKTTWTKELVSLPVPITIGTFYEAFQKEGVPGMIQATPDFFGMGSTYRDPNYKKGGQSTETPAEKALQKIESKTAKALKEATMTPEEKAARMRAKRLKKKD